MQINYLKLDVPKDTFEKIFRYKLMSIEIEKNKYSNSIQFIRFTHENWYMDVTIRKVSIKENVVIHLHSVVDYNKPRLK